MVQEHKNLLEQLSTAHSEKEAGNDFIYLMLSMAQGLTPNPKDAEDIVQDTLEVFLTTNPKQDVRNIYRYVYKTIKNRFISIVQSNKRREEREQKFLFVQELERQTLLDAENISSYKEMLLSSLKNRLNEKDYHFLELIYSGITDEEIAHELGVSVKRIKNRRSEILKKLSLSSIVIIFILHIGINIQNLIKNLVS